MSVSNERNDRGVVRRTERKSANRAVARGSHVVMILAGVLSLLGARDLLRAQPVTTDDYRSLRINEIIAANDTIGPQNWRCRHVDMIEIYNGSGKELALNHPSLGLVRLTDHSLQDFAPFNVRYLEFGFGVRTIRAGQRMIVFCDHPSDPGDRTDECKHAHEAMDFNEVHAPFRLDRDGELLTLEFVPRNAEGDEVEEDAFTIHEIRFPGIPDDVSFARYPEDVGNVDGWVFTTEPTFGQCVAPNPPVPLDWSVCLGEANGAGTPVAPDVRMIDYGTNNPAAGEPVSFRVRVHDEKTPDEANIQTVEIVYRVEGGGWQTEEMSMLALLTDSLDELNVWSIWEGSIPGQDAESMVEFSFRAIDEDGLEDTSPRGPMCPPRVGSCDPEDDPADSVDPKELGPGCSLGQDCRRPLSYTVASPYDGPLVINEVVPNNDTILADPTENASDCFFPSNPGCNFDDFIELYNQDSLNVDIAGVVVARGPFRPHRGWAFPSGLGTLIGPEEHLVVWTDGDGRDPRPGRIPPDPPNPNNPAKKEYHTDFTIDASSDELFLFTFDEAQKKYFLIDGVRWGTSGRYFTDPESGAAVDPLPLASSQGVRARIGGIDSKGMPVEEGLARSPDGSRSSAWWVVPAADLTPKTENLPQAAFFRRGDVNEDTAVDISDAVANLAYQFLPDPKAPTCLDAFDVDDSGSVDVSDPIFLLARLFLGGLEIPPPGMDSCGPDGTADDPHVACVYGADCQ